MRFALLSDSKIWFDKIVFQSNIAVFKAALDFEVVDERVEWAVYNETLIPEDLKKFFIQPEIVDYTTCLCGWI